MSENSCEDELEVDFENLINIVEGIQVKGDQATSGRGNKYSMCQDSLREHYPHCFKDNRYDSKHLIPLLFKIIKMHEDRIEMLECDVARLYEEIGLEKDEDESESETKEKN